MQVCIINFSILIILCIKSDLNMQIHEITNTANYYSIQNKNALLFMHFK